MTGIINFEAFILASVMLIITSGVDSIYIISRSIAQGKKAGVLSALGVSVGLIVHTIFAALGLSAILAQSAEAFMIVKMAGAGYLIFLGAKTLISKQSDNPLTTKKPTQKNRVFLSGMLTNVLNPKVALFFLAFLPQFIDPKSPVQLLPLLILGVTFTGMGLVYCMFLAFNAALFSRQIRNNPVIGKWMSRISGVVFILLGLKIAFSKK